ncbi:MAG TPA: PDZ domain-containing protein [Gemmatimonadaceae bacterium]|nr:PDZ domain-containing protein [Gemmatimonadaceae bacterium]
MNRASLRGIACLVVLTTAARYAHGQSAACPENRERAGTIGITRLECVGRSCNVSTRDERGGYAHSFAVEPRVGALDATVAPSRTLRVGDVVLAIDDVPITTREGGRRLANLAVGDTVRLRIRRDGEERELAVVPVLGCNTPGLSVRIP